MLDGVPGWILKPLLGAAQKWPWLSAKINVHAINVAANTCPHRPHPWSTFSDYVCWTSLTDQRFSARHLPASYQTGLPDPGAVVALFQRPDGEQQLCTKSTCLFPAFAQYLTDGFIRTVMPKTGEPPTLRKMNTSNHQIDMSPLYGRIPEQIQALRLLSGIQGQRGRLKSQIVNEEEYSPFLCTGDGKVFPGFECLDLPLGFNNITDPSERAVLFAAGGDRVNSAPQIAMINTLFLREHNRLAGIIEAENPDWDDERVFQTARNIIIVLFIKVVVEEYINHITPLPFTLRAVPSIAWNAAWNKPNWITTEFSLLYRWHSLIPDTMVWNGASYPVGDTLLNNKLLLGTGLAQSFQDMSAQKAGKLGVLNTAQALLPVEFNSVQQGRVCNVAPYIAYREYACLSVPQKIADISSDPRVTEALTDIYGSVDKIDFYAGLFAEDTVANSPLPEMILRLVAVDAFTQALTNPLLSEHVFNEGTFTKYGWKMISQTATLAHILKRNCKLPGGAHVGMTQRDWQYQ